MAREFNLAGSDDVQAIARLTFLENGGSPRIFDGFHLLDEVVDGFWVDTLENTRARENLVYFFHF